MDEKLIQILNLTLKDIKENHSKFDKNTLRKVIIKFQHDLLNLYELDNELKTELENLQRKDIIETVEQLKLELLDYPTQKNKLVPLINGLILQNNKKTEFIQAIYSKKTNIVESKTKSKSKPESKKKATKSTLQTNDFDEIRKRWLTKPSLNELEAELNTINMKDIRTIVKPWRLKPKDTKKESLIKETLNYNQKLRNLTKLGT